MATTKCVVKFGDNRIFKIKVQDPCTVAALQLKIRKFLKLSEYEALFLFFKFESYGLMGNKQRQRLYNGNKLVSQILRENSVEVLNIDVLKENCFGSYNIVN